MTISWYEISISSHLCLFFTYSLLPGVPLIELNTNSPHTMRSHWACVSIFSIDVFSCGNTV